MLQQVGFFARLYARGKPTNYLLTLYCFPLHLKEQVYTPLPPIARNVCAQGGGGETRSSHSVKKIRCLCLFPKHLL